MPYLSIPAGTTSKIIKFEVYDSSSTLGAMLTGLVFNTSNLTCYYDREGAAGSATAVSLVTATKGTWTSSGFVAVDGTNMQGWYELHIPDAALASGAQSVSVQLDGATNMVPVNLLIELTATNNQDAVRGGMTALPNANAAASGGLVVLGANATAISFTGGMTISSSTGDALALSSSGSNGNALNASGNGTGAGIKATGGATGNGLQVLGGATSGSAIKATGTAGNAIALELAGQGSAAGLSATGGATGIGMTAIGGATSGTGFKCTGTAGNAIALELVGQGSAAGLSSTGGATGSAWKLVGGGTSGHGLAVTTTSGDGFNLTPTAGNAITAAANGTSKHGIVATGGTAGTSDGVSMVAGTGGVDLRANQTGNITGNLSGSAGSVTGAVGSVTARVTANTDQWAGTTIPAPAVTGVPKVDVVDIAGATVSTSTAQLGVNAVQIGAVVPASATIGTVTTTTTATNLTNAATSGDLTSTMKTSVENAVWDAARSSHVTTGVFGQLGQEILRDNTATAGAASSLTLDASATTTVDFYKGDVVYLYSGTGSGQSRVISAYSAGRVATVVPNWVTTPDNTSKFILTAQRTPLVGTDTRILTSADSSTSGETVAAVTGAVGSVTGAVGSVTGAVGSVTGAVGSVTGNVGGNVVGSVASVTARVTANADQWAGTTIPAPSVTGVPKVDLVDIAGSTVSTSSAQLGVNAVQIGASVPGSATIGTVTTTTTATNLTNAPTSGDFTSTMKTSLNAATPASIAGAVGSVTGNVGGNVVGSVASVTADVGITQAGADKVWSTTTRAITDKVGFALSSAGIQAIWDALTSALSTASSIGKLIVDNINATISSRSTYAGSDTSGTTTLLGRLTSTRAGNLDNLDATISGQGNPTGTVVAGTNSATTFATDRTETANNYWKDTLLLLTSGVMAGQVKKVSAYNGTTKEITVGDGFTGTPADGVTFSLENR